MSAKGKFRDKSLSKLGNRMITTMLKNEKLAEKELEKKMKAIKDLERKSMVKICETSLDVKYDIRRKRNTQDMEEQLAEENLNVSFTQGKVLLSPSTSRRGSSRPASLGNEDDLDDTASNYSQETSTSTNPSILINNERKENDSEQDPDSRGSSFGSVQTEAPSAPTASPCETPPEEMPTIDETEAQNALKVFSQSPRGSRRRRTAPEIADLSPKLLIQLAKSSVEVKRQGSTHDASEGESLAPAQSAPTRRPGSATADLMQSKEREKEKTKETNGQETNFSPSSRKTGSAVATNTSGDRGLNSPPGSPLLLRRRGSSSVTNSKNSLSLELSEALLKDKISEQSQLSPRLKQPISPLVGRRSSGVASTLHPMSGHSLAKGLNTDAESMLPDLKGAGLTKRPSSPSGRRSPMRKASSLTRPSTARSPSSLSADGVSGDAQSGNLPGTGEYDLGRRRGSRPISARSCYSLPPSGPSLLPLDRMLGNLATRRGLEVSSIDLHTLSPTSPLRKAMEDPQATLNPAPVSPSVYRRHSVTVEALQGRVDDFLKTLAAKSS